MNIQSTHRHAGKCAGIALLSILLGTSAALAQDGRVAISSPQDGATHDASKPLVVEFAADPGPRGDHVHVYVDAGKPRVVRSLKGSETISDLPPGMHDICIKLVTRDHVPTGAEDCVKVQVVAGQGGAMGAPMSAPEPRRGYGY
ncbi:MAG: hypothetical protein AB1713_01225 [Pseudomonadota bacterium]